MIVTKVHYLVQMVKNVLKTKAEIARKNNRSKVKVQKCKRMLANKILKQSNLKKLASKILGVKGKITIDVNVNFNLKK